MYAVVLTTDNGGCESVNVYINEEKAVQSAMGLCAEYGIEYPEEAQEDAAMWDPGYSNETYIICIKETEITY